MLSDAAAVRTAAIVLASSSPRRVNVFNDILQLQAEVIPSTFPEDLDKAKFSPSAYVEENAKQKAMEVHQRLAAEGNERSLIVGADTVVVLDGRILEKPRSTQMAKEMLSCLSGSSHEVMSGVALVYAPVDGSGGPPLVHTFVETTRVQFGTLSADIIDAYITTGEPMDKAGGYGIQGLGGSFVSGIEGCYWNVVGFPMHRFCVECDCARLRAWCDRKGL